MCRSLSIRGPRPGPLWVSTRRSGTVLWHPFLGIQSPRRRETAASAASLLRPPSPDSVHTPISWRPEPWPGSLARQGWRFSRSIGGSLSISSPAAPGNIPSKWERARRGDIYTRSPPLPQPRSKLNSELKPIGFPPLLWGNLGTPCGERRGRQTLERAQRPPWGGLTPRCGVLPREAVSRPAPQPSGDTPLLSVWELVSLRPVPSEDQEGFP